MFDGDNSIPHIGRLFSAGGRDDADVAISMIFAPNALEGYGNAEPELLKYARELQCSWKMAFLTSVVIELSSTYSLGSC
jgi:hypothetical protein